MSSFVLHVPVDPRFRVLAPEIAGKYVDVLGGSDADRQALSAAVTDALAALARDASPEGVIDLAFTSDAASIEIVCRSAGKSSVVRHALTAAKR